MEFDMKFCTSLKRFVCLSLLLLSISSAFASNLLITGHFSGSQDQPDQESQGIVLQIGVLRDGTAILETLFPNE